MSYSIGKSNAKKHCYSIYLRQHGVGALAPWTSGIVGLTASELKTNTGSDLADWAEDSPTWTVGDFGKIGAIEGSPSITGSEGDSIDLASCDAHTISENMEGAFNNIEVTKGNYQALRALSKQGPVDVLFYDEDNPDVSVGARKVNLKVFPNIVGNDLNKIEMSFSKEVGNLDDYFDFVTIT